MGRPKALLPHIDPTRTFLAHLIESARIADSAPVLVVGRRDDFLTHTAAVAAGGIFVPNDAADQGQLSSLIAGVNAAEAGHADGVIVLPVDVPLVSAAVIRRLIELSSVSDALILRATHHGRHGHPVLFKNALFEELRTADPSIGAKAVVRRVPARVQDVEVEEPGVTVDVDTPEDYERVFGRRI